MCEFMTALARPDRFRLIRVVEPYVEEPGSCLNYPGVAASRETLSLRAAISDFKPGNSGASLIRILRAE
jgi:hypothetical protein